MTPDVAGVLSAFALGLVLGLGLGLRLGFLVWRKTYVQADRIGIYRTRRPF